MTGKDSLRIFADYLPEDWRSRLAMACASAAVWYSAVQVRDWVAPATASAQQPAAPAAKAPAGQAPAAKSPAPRTSPAGTAQSAPPATAAAQGAAAQAAGTAQGGAAPAAGRTEIPETVAVVNHQRITRTQLGEQCLERFGEEVLESLVNKHLIMQECQKRSIVISPEDVDREIAATAARFNLSTDLWLKMLQEERHINAERYRQDIIWPMLALQRLAADKLTVTPEQLQKAFESQFGAKVQVRMIATTTPQRAEEALAKAKANPDQFGALAKEYSEDSNSAAARGLIPPIRKHMGEPEVEQAVFALKEGELSPVVNVHGQYLVFKCERHIPPTHIPPQTRKQTEDRLKQQIVDENLRTAATDLFGRLQQDAKVVNVFNNAELTKQHPGVAALVNDKPVPIQYLMNECLVRYAPEVLESEIRYTLLSQSLKKSNLSVSEDDIRTEIARAAESYGYFDASGEKADVDRWLKVVTDEQGLQIKHYVRDAVWPSAALKKMVAAEITITPDDLQKGFEANYGPRVEVLAIVVSNQRVAQEVWDLARKNPTKAYFGQLAAQYSIEPVSRANMGEVPPIQRHSGQESLEKAAFELTNNDRISGIVAVGDTFVIMYYVGRTEPVVAKLEDVKDELTKDIHEKKLRLAMADKYDQLMAASQIDNFLVGTSQSPVAATARRDQAVKPVGSNTKGGARPIPVQVPR
ncbi:MAG: peptidylprolyl isomerase [Pirellulales bacterium]